MELEIKDNYDVIIVGAGIAGLQCALDLKSSGLKILIIEKNNNLGDKVCANGVTPEDLPYLPAATLTGDLQNIIINYKNRKIAFPRNKKVITTVNRRQLLVDKLRRLAGCQNIDVLTSRLVSQIVSGHRLRLNNGREITYRYLVGADGSNSMVRKYLQLPLKKFALAAQYLIPARLPDFEIFLDHQLFGSGFLWIFPNRKFTSIGCGSDIGCISGSKLKQNLDNWLKQQAIDISRAKFQAAIINYDYRGYRFGHVFLAGDAAGLASGLSGKGIYPAALSGRQIAYDILKKKNPPNLIYDWLKKKGQQEKYLRLLKNKLLRKLCLPTLIRLAPNQFIETKIINLIF